MLVNAYPRSPRPEQTLRLLPDPDQTLVDHRPAGSYIRELRPHGPKHEDHEAQAEHHEHGHLHDPGWIAHGLDHLKHEVILFVRTLWGFSVRPRQTGADWVAGRIRLMHPLSFLIKSLAVATTARGLWWARFGLPEPSLGTSIGHTAGPYVYVVVLGALVHFAFRRSGSRQTLSTSLAGLLYALGAAPTFIDVVGDPLQHAVQPAWLAVRALGPAFLSAGPKALALAALYPIAKTGSFIPHFLFLGATLAGIHGTSRRRGAAIVIAGFVAFMALFFAVVILAVIGAVLAKKYVLH